MVLCTGVVLNGNSLYWQISVQALKIMKNKIPTGNPRRSCGPVGTSTKECGHARRFSVQKVQTPVSLSPMHKSACTWEYSSMVHGISPTVFNLMVLVCGIASKNIDPRYWVHGIVLLWFWTVVL